MAEGIRSLKASGVTPAQVPYQSTQLMAALRSAKINGASGPISYPPASNAASQNDRLGNPKPWYYKWTTNGFGNDTQTLGFAIANFSFGPSNFMVPIMFPTDTSHTATTSKVPAFCYGGTAPVPAPVPGSTVVISNCVPCLNGTLATATGCVACPASGVWCVIHRDRFCLQIFI